MDNYTIFGQELPLLVLALAPLAFAMLFVFLEKIFQVTKFQKRLMHTLAVVAGTTDFLLAIAFLYENVSNFGNAAFTSNFIGINLAADTTSLFFILVFTTVHFAVSIYCINYMHQFDELPRFYALLLTCVAGLNLIAVSTDFFTMFVAFEMMNLCAYAMVGFYRSRDSSEASFKYLIMSSTGAILVLYGIALLYATLGDISYAALAAMTPGNNVMVTIAGILMILGFGVTSAILFFNQWLPDAHPAAPPPAHAMLSGIVTLGGVYGMLRTALLVVPLDNFTNQNWGEVLIVIGLLTSLQGNLFALIQFMRTDEQARNLKRIFAFSTISHMGYLITGLGAGIASASVIGLSGVLLHAFSHAVAKGVLFMITGYMIYTTKTYYLDAYKGLGRREPIIGVCLVIGLFSLAGIPGTIGFWSKLQIILGLFELGNPLGVSAGVLMVLFTFLATAGYLLIIKWMIFEKSTQDQKYIDQFDEINLSFRKSWSMKTAFVILAIFNIYFGLFPGTVADAAMKAATLLLI